jgi:membrane-bound inhibitor of C-type lysozyme
MTIRNMTAWCLAVLLAVGAGCARMEEGVLTARPQAHVIYRCENGERIVAGYYSLQDRSLDFVKLRLPDGAEITLPRAMSASGVRYTDDREWVWWTKGDSAFAETRTPNGEWRIRYANCRSTAEER